MFLVAAAPRGDLPDDFASRVFRALGSGTLRFDDGNDDAASSILKSVGSCPISLYASEIYSRIARSAIHNYRSLL
ncbi:hypothetical protein D3C75_1336820 [compost metagenome]